MRLLRLGFFVAGLAILVYLFLQLGLADILRLVARTRWTFLVLLLIYASCETLRACALWLCQAHPGTVRFPEILGIRMSGEAVRMLTFTGPFLAEPSKAWLLGRRGLDMKEGVAAIIVEFVAYNLIAATIAAGAFAYLVTNFDMSPAIRTAVVTLVWINAAFVGIAVVAIALRIYLIGAIVRGLVAIGLLRFARNRDEVRRMEDLLLLVLRDRPVRLALILACELGANLLLMAEVFVALGAMGFPVSALFPVLIEGSIKFVGLAFFFVPTQVGVAEGTYAVLFDILGLTAAAGVSLAFLRRLRGLAGAAIGLVAMTLLSGDRVA